MLYSPKASNNTNFLDRDAYLGLLEAISPSSWNVTFGLPIVPQPPLEPCGDMPEATEAMTRGFFCLAKVAVFGLCINNSLSSSPGSSRARSRSMAARARVFMISFFGPESVTLNVLPKATINMDSESRSAKSANKKGPIRKSVAAFEIQIRWY